DGGGMSNESDRSTRWIRHPASRTELAIASAAALVESRLVPVNSTMPRPVKMPCYSRSGSPNQREMVRPVWKAHISRGSMTLERENGAYGVDRTHIHGWAVLCRLFFVGWAVRHRRYR